MRGRLVSLLVLGGVIALVSATGEAQQRRRSARRLVPDDPSPGAARLVQPRDLFYLGAFRLPPQPEWSYSGYAMAFNPDGDRDGPDDGFPGSLFVLGHDHQQLVAEVAIPRPAISPMGDLGRLATARILQPLADITGGMFGPLEIPRAGLAVLPPQAGQRTPKLHFCWGQHFQEFAPSHGWCELDLTDPRPAGPWRFGAFTNYVSNDYLFEIPEQWAAAHTPGRLLATGRFRDGRWSGLGPALFAYGPWNDGDPPPPNHRLTSITPLLLYGTQESGVVEIGVSDSRRMSGFAEADEWSGGAWLTDGPRSAVVFAGTKATGRSWYGFANGVEYPIDDPGDPDAYPEVPEWPYDQRGWWSDGIQAQILFYDPDELAAVADGASETWQPQPYASLVLDDELFDPGFDLERGKRYLVGAVAFDRGHGLLYIVERMADDEERSLIHVWRVARPGSHKGQPRSGPTAGATPTATPSPDPG